MRGWNSPVSSDWANRWSKRCLNTAHGCLLGAQGKRTAQILRKQVYVCDPEPVFLQMFAITALATRVGQLLGMAPARKINKGPGKRVMFKGVMQPHFFKQPSWELFRDLKLKTNDVVMVSIRARAHACARLCECVHVCGGGGGGGGGGDMG
jgi:hypothetical protein